MMHFRNRVYCVRRRTAIVVVYLIANETRLPAYVFTDSQMCGGAHTCFLQFLRAPEMCRIGLDPNSRDCKLEY